MVDPVDPKRFETYRVRDVLDSEGQRGRQQQQEEDNPSQEGKSFFAEKTDWRLLYEKTPHTTKAKTVMAQDIDHLIFQSVSIKNNPSILEAKLIYKTQKTEEPVFILISREMALKLQLTPRGSRMSAAEVTPLTHLQVLIPEPVSTIPRPIAAAVDVPLSAAQLLAAAQSLGKRLLHTTLARLRSDVSLELGLLYTAALLLVICLALVVLAYF